MGLTKCGSSVHSQHSLVFLRPTPSASQWRSHPTFVWGRAEEKKTERVSIVFFANYFAHKTYTFWKVESKTFRLHQLSAKSVEGARRTSSKRPGYLSETWIHKGIFNYEEQRISLRDHRSWEIARTFGPRSPNSADEFCWKLVQSKALDLYFSKNIDLLGEIFRNNCLIFHSVYFLLVRLIPGSSESPTRSSLT